MLLTLRQLALLLGLALLPALASAGLQLRWRPQPTLQPGEIRPATARLWGQHVLWVDGREQAQYDKKHIPGAILCNQAVWDSATPALLARWNSDLTIVLYGQDNDESAVHVLAQRLRDELKFETVYVLKGGWKAWQE